MYEMIEMFESHHPEIRVPPLAGPKKNVESLIHHGFVARCDLSEGITSMKPWSSFFWPISWGKFTKLNSWTIWWDIEWSPVRSYMSYHNNFDHWYPNILGLWDPKIRTMNQASGGWGRYELPRWMELLRDGHWTIWERSRLHFFLAPKAGHQPKVWQSKKIEQPGSILYYCTRVQLYAARITAQTQKQWYPKLVMVFTWAVSESSVRMEVWKLAPWSTALSRG